MPKQSTELKGTARALLEDSMTDTHWSVIDEVLRDLRSRYQFFDQSASYCFDAGWVDTLAENEQRLNVLRPQIEALDAARIDPKKAADLLVSIAEKS